MRTLTVRKVGETEKAVQYCVTFWIVEHPGHPICGEGKEFFFNRWLPKRVVTPIDDTHIGIPKKFLEETLKILADKHPFISDKQSWILAVAAVENNITL